MKAEERRHSSTTEDDCEQALAAGHEARVFTCFSARNFAYERNLDTVKMLHLPVGP